MRRDPKPYLRADLAEGANTRATILAEADFPSNTISHNDVLRLLDTVDNLYEHTDLVTMEAQGLRTKNQELDAALKEARKREFAQLGERMNRIRNADRYAALPEDVQALQEEVAAWKDEYAKMKQYRDNLQRSTDHLIEQRDRALARVAKLRKQRKINKGLAAMVTKQDRLIGELTNRVADSL